MDIVFRGIRVDNGEWTYGYLFKIWEKNYILWGTINGIPNMIEVDFQSIGQYTGVSDKNNKQIYSNDILKCEAQNYIGNVWFANGSFMTNCEGFGDHPISETNSNDFEVIGNTLQNAELLKG